MDRSKMKTVIPLIYAAIMVTAYLVFPPNPDKITIPMDLVAGFRVVSAFTIAIFWGLMGITLGAFWDKLKSQHISNLVRR